MDKKEELLKKAEILENKIKEEEKRITRVKINVKLDNIIRRSNEYL